MNNSDVFNIFMEAYKYITTILGKNFISKYYQSVKRTEEESGLKFYYGSKKKYVGSLYIYRMRRSRVYFIGWWRDNEKEDLFFDNKRKYLGWKKKVKSSIKTSIPKIN